MNIIWNNFSTQMPSTVMHFSRNLEGRSLSPFRWGKVDGSPTPDKLFSPPRLVTAEKFDQTFNSGKNEEPKATTVMRFSKP